MLKVIAIVAGIIVIVFAGLFAWSACVLASWADREMEEYMDAHGWVGYDSSDGDSGQNLES